MFVQFFCIAFIIEFVKRSYRAEMASSDMPKFLRSVKDKRRSVCLSSHSHQQVLALGVRGKPIHASTATNGRSASECHAKTDPRTPCRSLLCRKSPLSRVGTSRQSRKSLQFAPLPSSSGESRLMRPSADHTDSSSQLHGCLTVLHWNIFVFFMKPLAALDISQKYILKRYFVTSQWLQVSLHRNGCRSSGLSKKITRSR
jgi:hypothetical protein